jgi:hypothetical protein
VSFPDGVISVLPLGPFNDVAGIGQESAILHRGDDPRGIGGAYVEADAQFITIEAADASPRV